MKYILDKKIFWTNITLCILLVGSIIYLEGTNVITKKTETITCPQDSITTCKVITPQGKTYELQKGERIIRNQFNQTNLDIANYGVWIIMTLSLLTNHIIHNKKYPIKKQIKKLYNKIRNIKNN